MDIRGHKIKQFNLDETSKRFKDQTSYVILS
jgi:hypothetical protein